MSNWPPDPATPAVPPIPATEPTTNELVQQGTQVSPAGSHTVSGAGSAPGTDALPCIADYVVLKKLGEGGMGAVYLAEDPRLGRKVALKTMKRELAVNSLDRDRFLREARAAAAVDSDYVVPIWSVGEAADGTPFIAMPFLQGETLDARLRREPVAGPGFLLKVVHEVAEGLTAAHAVGLIHRDIKPTNIWLEGDISAKEPAERIRRCKVLDFGLARSADRADVQITASGAILGTPAFMAPEQARGEEIDARADLFSLGVTLYRMATGRPPFDGPTPIAVLISLATDSPPPIREAAPAVPPELAALIDRLMSKARDGRPQSAVEVVAAVRRIAGNLQQEYVPCAAPARIESPTIDVSDLGPISTSTPQLLAEGAPESRPPRAKRVRVPQFLLIFGLLVLLGAGAWLVSRGDRTVSGEARQNDAPKEWPQKKDEPPKTIESVKKDEPLKKESLPPAGRADRQAALWVLSVTGSVLIEGEPEQIREAGRLPKEPFRLAEVYLTVPVKDSALAVFADCKDITVAFLVGTQITNAGLAHFANCKNLADLSLPGTKVNDEAVPFIARFTKLTGLSIGATGITAKGAKELAKALPSCRIQYGATFDPATDDDRSAAEFVLSVGGKVGVNYTETESDDTKLLPKDPFRLTTINLTGIASASDAELDRFKTCMSLTRLILTGTPVSDVGLGAIKEFAKLSHLDLRKTKVTEKGVAAVAQSLPGCEITWDGGLIRPKR